MIPNMVKTPRQKLLATRYSLLASSGFTLIEVILYVGIVVVCNAKNCMGA